MWEAVILVAGLIWDGISVAATTIIYWLSWSVAYLWGAMIALYNGAIAIGVTIYQGFQKAWDFVKLTYDDVLKPAWDKLHELFTRVRDWLNETFGPVINALKAIRKYILDFYKDWIRPILDAIDQTRAILKILEALHIEWAQTLDNLLGEIEGAVNRALLAIVGPLNKVIGIVNGVVTGDLLFQRFPFLLTLKRDSEHAFGMFWRTAMSKPVDAGDDYSRGRDYPEDAPGANGKELAQFYRGEDNRMQGFVDELVPLWVKATKFPPDEVYAAAK